MVMFALQFHLAQVGTQTATTATAAGADEVRTAALLMVVLLATFTAVLAKVAEGVRIVLRVLKALLLALVAGLIVATVVILACADLMAG
jgi:hypothetical protein